MQSVDVPVQANTENALFDAITQSAMVGEQVDPEPKRDWGLGPVTGHRVAVVLCMTLFTLGLLKLQSVLWPSSKGPVGLLPEAWNWGTLLWLGAVIPGAAGLVGMLMFRHSRRLNEAAPIPQMVSWRIVSRGTNVEALTSTVRRCQAEMAKTPLFPYVIEVVTDTHTPFLDVPNHDIVYITVPKNYRTPKGTLYKARGRKHSGTPIVCCGA
jgi:egghead protein (zeste-white 4 protein)